MLCALRWHYSETRNLKKSRWLCNALFSVTQHKNTHSHTQKESERETGQEEKGDREGEERENVILLHKIRQLSKHNK